MNCCSGKKDCVEEKVLSMQNDALSVGFDAEWVADILEKYGPQVLEWAIEIVRNGVTAVVVRELLVKFGPLLLEFLFNIFGVKNGWLSVTEVSNDEVVLAAASDTWLSKLVEKNPEKVIEALKNRKV